MADDDEEDRPPALTGADAIDWLKAQKFGGDFFDGAIQGVQIAFGANKGVAAVVLADDQDEPRDFYLCVVGRVDNDEDAERLISAHEYLLRSSDRLT